MKETKSHSGNRRGVWMALFPKCFLIGFSLCAVTALIVWRQHNLTSATTLQPTVNVVSAPATVAQTVAATDPGAQRPQALEHMPARVDALDPIRQKLEQWRRTTNLREKFDLMQELLKSINDENAADIARSLSAEDLAGQFGVAALDRWLAVDARTAAEWLATRTGTTAEQASMVARKLLADSDGFQSYLANLPDGEWKQKMIGAAGYELASSDPQKAIALAERVESSEARAGLLVSAAFQYAASDPAAAKKWADGIADSELRDQIVASAAKGFAAKDPEAAAEWLVSSVKNQELLGDAAQSIVRSWAATDPTAAANWVSQFPSGPARTEALDTLINFWNASNPSAVSAWVSQLSDDDLRKSSLAIIAHSSSQTAQ